MSELGEKVKASIERLKAFAPKNGDGYYLAFSGGKDSVVIKALADMAGVKYDAHYRVTSVDPPELVQFIRDKHPDVHREIPRYSDDYKNPKLAGKQITPSVDKVKIVADHFGVTVDELLTVTDKEAADG